MQSDTDLLAAIYSISKALNKDSYVDTEDFYEQWCEAVADFESYQLEDKVENNL